MKIKIFMDIYKVDRNIIDSWCDFILLDNIDIRLDISQVTDWFEEIVPPVPQGYGADTL